MKYSEVLGATFRALKSGAVWLFSLTALLGVAACLGVVAALVYAIDPTPITNALGGIAAPEAEFAIGMLRFYAVMILGGLISLPVFLVAYAGLIHLADAALAGRAASIGEGWSFGLKRAGRLLGIEAVLYFAYMLGIAVLMVPFIAVVLGISAAGSGVGEEAAVGGIIAGACFGYLIFFALVLVLVVAYTGIESLSSRYGLVGDRTVGDALSAGWKAFRARWKNVVVFSLIVLGITYAWSLATSVVLSPLTLLTMPWSTLSEPSAEPSAAEFATMMDRMLIFYALTLVFMVPSYVFTTVAWTAFFRRLTGLDAPAVAPVAPPWASFPGSGYPAQPPMPPAGYPQPPAPPAEQLPAPPAEQPSADRFPPQPPAPPAAPGA